MESVTGSQGFVSILYAPFESGAFHKSTVYSFGVATITFGGFSIF